MKFLIIVGLIAIAAGCSLVSPVYQFYAHRHAVPMLSADYLEIPEDSPKDQTLYNKQYQLTAEQALSLLEAHQKSIHSPGISAAVAIDGELIWAGVSGWSDIKAKEPLTTASQFRIGSTSKALNATLLARMVDSGMLSLDAPLADFPIIQRNAQWGQITPRQLASHMGGIPHYKENTDWAGLYRSMSLNKRYSDVEDAVSVFDSSQLLFQPGEQFYYSSLGTVLLSAVMQQAANTHYQNAMDELVLKPLQMSHTLAEPTAKEYPTQSPNIVEFYWHPDKQQPTVVEWRDVDLSHRLAGGGFISTSTDLVKMGLGFVNSSFVSDSTRSEFWTPQTLNNGDINEQHYAIGWRVRESDFGENLGSLFHANHGGVSRGAQSWLMVIPEYKMVVAVNINSNTEQFWDFGKVSFELVNLFLTHKK